MLLAAVDEPAEEVEEEDEVHSSREPAKKTIFTRRSRWKQACMDSNNLGAKDGERPETQPFFHDCPININVTNSKVTKNFAREELARNSLYPKDSFPPIIPKTESCSSLGLGVLLW